MKPALPCLLAAATLSLAACSDSTDIEDTERSEATKTAVTSQSTEETESPETTAPLEETEAAVEDSPEAPPMEADPAAGTGKEPEWYANFNDMNVIDPSVHELIAEYNDIAECTSAAQNGQLCVTGKDGKIGLFGLLRP